MRYFEKISFEQFKKDIIDDIELYNSFVMPKRATKLSAGYDFFALYDYTLKPGEIMKIPTGLKARMHNDETLFLMDRGSMGFKYNVRFCNQIGVIDADYYNNSNNEGHMWIKIQNEGDKDYSVKKGEGMCQGIFMKYLVTDDEEKIENNREGGFGSTTKGES
jgi:dUTPase